MDSMPRLSEAATAAMRLAAGRRPDGWPLTTAAVFAALPEVDHEAAWERLWLQTGDPRALRLPDAPDGGALSAARWAGAPATRDLAVALSLAEEMREAYGFPVVTPGLMAVALVADPAFGAARVLTGSGLTHEALLDLVQSEIFGSTLENLPGLVDRHLSGRRLAPAAVVMSLAVPQPAPAPPIPALEPVRTAAPEPSPAPPATAVRPRLRRAGWVALSILSVLGILFATRTSPSFHSSPPRITDPPFARPAFVEDEDMVATADVAAVLGAQSMQTQDRLPDLKLWRSNSAIAADLRMAAYVGGWQREWSSVDQARFALVRVVEVTRPLHLVTLQRSCSPSVPAVTSTVASATSGFLIQQTGDGEDVADFCGVFEQGTFSVFVEVGLRGAGAAAFVQTAAQDLAARQLALLRDRAPAAGPVPPMHYTRDSINRWLILAAIVLPLAFALPLTLLDRATWRRLARRLRRRKSRDPFTVSMDPAGRLALSQATALGLVKVAVYVWLLRLAEVLPLGTFKTAGLLFAAFCVLSLAESRLLHGARGRYRPRPFRGSGRLLAVGGFLLTGAAVVGAFFVADVALSVAALGFNPAGADYITGRFGLVGLGLSVLLLALAVLPLMMVRRVAMLRIRREAQQSPGRHIILLRSFVDDNRRVRARRLDRASLIDRLCLRRWERFEEIIATALSTIGPVIALGRPGERLPPALGAVRQQFTMDAWQAGVRDLIQNAALVCMIAGRTESLVIELREIKRLGALHRTLFLVPPCGRGEQRRRLALLSHELGIPWNRMEQATRGSDVLLVLQNADPERAVILTGRSPDDVGYEAAIKAAAHLAGQPAEATAVVRQVVADFRRRAAGAGPATSVLSPPPPSVHVYAPGKAPVYRPLYRQYSVLPWLLSAVGSVIVACVGFVVNVNLRDLPVVLTGSGTVTSLAEDDVTGRLYAAIDGRWIAAVDPKEKKFDVVGKSAVYIGDLIVHGLVAYGRNPLDGSVTAIDLTTHAPLWTVQPAPGLRGLALAGGLLVTTVPARHEVIALSARDGRQVAKQTVPGTPWGVVASGGRLVVPLIDRDELAYLSAVDLTPANTVATVAGPQRVLVQGAKLWVLAPVEDRVVRQPADGTPGVPGEELWLSDPGGVTSASSEWFAVQGSERITLVSAAGRIIRVALPFSDIDSMCVTRNGHLFVGTKGQVAQMR
jgi:hypothetical protein